MDVKQLLTLNYPLPGETLDNLQRREHRTSFRAFEKKFVSKTGISLEELIAFGNREDSPSMQLTDTAAQKLTLVLTGYCRAVTVEKVGRRLARPLSLMPRFPWGSRIHFLFDGSVTYTVNLGNAAELSEIRKNILSN